MEGDKVIRYLDIIQTSNSTPEEIEEELKVLQEESDKLTECPEM